MTIADEKAHLRLRVVGPLEGEQSLPLGATAWISTGEEDALVVDIPIGIVHEPAIVDVPAGRVVIVLRTPAGRRGRREIVLQPGEVRSFEFGEAEHRSRITVSESFLELPPIRPTQEPPIDPDKIEQCHPRVVMHGASFGGDMVGGTWGGAWMPQIHKVQVFYQEHSGSNTLARCAVRKSDIPREIYAFDSAATHLELGMVGSFAFVVEPAAPHQAHVLFHRAAWTHEMLRFTVKPRQDATTIPIDTEVILADQRVMSLLAFVANGDLPSARAQAAQFSKAAEGYLSKKFTNHHLAAVGAYALHVLRETDKYADWIRTLYEYFEDTADGAILYAMHLMRARPGAVSEWYDEARTALIKAAARPIPVLTIGVNLLAQGLERLASSRRAAGDQELAHALERAQWIQARARPDELFTALWIERSELPNAFLPYNVNEVSSKH